ncbi:hypothetical protein ADK41_07765 [Streptomyces caelestis]|uniref:Uncharacterized protein n=1 Tax=Streptomyces caelestis TaxID=36816 RepID=A0A0M9XA07_9ACTN|nr:hypothetical protein ADK41_07765 [Streptomyces caelestis]KOV35596.1 hypothetical protein ADK58_02285 [Streptomyces sp. XY152]
MEPDDRVRSVGDERPAVGLRDQGDRPARAGPDLLARGARVRDLVDGTTPTGAVPSPRSASR